jgi:TorA maturation chaperone TorD
MISDKVELYLCLSQAFLPPTTDAAYAALRDHLADDLGELASVSGYPVAAELTAWREAMDGIADQEALLVAYSRLFLVPGDAQPAINAGVYLDGTVNGNSVAAMEDCYRRCGLEPDRAQLADLPDHVARQLEFVAYLYAEAAARERGEAAADLPVSAGEFLATFVARWAPAFRADLEAATARFGLDANPYVALARILEAAARSDAVAPRPQALDRVAEEIAERRAQAAVQGLGAADLARIRALLEADGLATDHLSIPLAARDAAVGMERLAVPQARRHASIGAQPKALGGGD